MMSDGMQPEALDPVSMVTPSLNSMASGSPCHGPEVNTGVFTARHTVFAIALHEDSSLFSFL